MRNATRWSTAMLMGMTMGVTACGGNDNAANGDSAGMAAGEVSAAPGAMGDSAGMMAGAGGAGGNAGAAVASLDAPGIMAVMGASNAAEIATSQVAVEKATNGDVKSYAQRMITEHQAMQKQADQLATRLNVTPSTPEPATQKTQMANQMAEQLRTAAKGEAFDRQYMDGQVMAHQQTLTELQAMQGNQNAPAEVRTLIEQAIPKVQQHLQEAQQMVSRMGGATGGTTGGTTGGQ